MKIKQWLKIGGISGISLIISTFLLIVFSMLIAFFSENKFFSFSLIVLVIIISISYIFYYVGLILLSKKFKKKLLMVMSIFQVIFPLFILIPKIDFLLPLFFGVINLIYGIAFLKFKDKFGIFATTNGALRIIAGGYCILFIFMPFAALYFPPIIILETVILFKATKLK